MEAAGDEPLLADHAEDGRMKTNRKLTDPRQPPTNVVIARNWHFQYLAEHMRPDEIEHWMALTGAVEYDSDTAAAGFIATPGLKLALVNAEGYPLAAGGYHEVSRGVYEGWMVGSMEGWSSHWRSMTKAVRWMLANAFGTLGARRLYITTLATRTCATDWYRKALGMQYEGTARKLGAHGEDMVTYARVSP